MVAGKPPPEPRDQRRQESNEIQWFEHHVRGAVEVRSLELVAHHPLDGDRPVSTAVDFIGRKNSHVMVVCIEDFSHPDQCRLLTAERAHLKCLDVNRRTLVSYKRNPHMRRSMNIFPSPGILS